MTSRSWLAGIAFAMLAVSLPAAAALGGDVASVEVDQTRLDAVLRATPAYQFTQFELQLPSGATVREYVSVGGTVFALTWEGPALPDLRQLLSSYFQQYVDAIQGGGPGARVIRQSGLVVFSGGHLRAFRGRAYVPQLQPPGVAAEELQ